MCLVFVGWITFHTRKWITFKRSLTIASKLRRTPTIEEASKYGVNIDLLKKRLNKTWPALLEMAQITPDIETLNASSSSNAGSNSSASGNASGNASASASTSRSVIAKEQMLENLRYVARSLGYFPSELKYDLLGSYSSSTLKYRFDKSWIAIIDLAKSNNTHSLATQSIAKEKAFLNKTIVEFLGVSPAKK